MVVPVHHVMRLLLLLAPVIVIARMLSIVMLVDLTAAGTPAPAPAPVNPAPGVLIVVTAPELKLTRDVVPAGSINI